MQVKTKYIKLSDEKTIAINTNWDFVEDTQKLPTIETVGELLQDIKKELFNTLKGIEVSELTLHSVVDGVASNPLSLEQPLDGLVGGESVENALLLKYPGCKHSISVDMKGDVRAPPKVSSLVAEGI